MTKTFIDILEELEKETSTNNKIALITVNKDNTELKEFLRLALDKNITYGIAEFDYISKRQGGDDSIAFSNFSVLINELIQRKITGHAALNRIKAVFALFTERQAKWFEKGLKKDLASIGIGQRLYEQAYDEKGFKFRLMLAAPQDEIDMVEDEPGYLDKKANGVCTIPIVENNKLDIIYGGRNGLTAENFYFIKDELESLVKALGDEWKSAVFHGEVHVKDCLEDTMSLYGFKFRSINDFMGKTGKLKQKAWDDYCADYDRIMKFKSVAKFSIFEIIPLDAWNAQSYSVTLEDRKKFYLKTVKPKIEELGLTKIEIIPTEKVPNKEAAIDAAQVWIKNKFEGGIWKRNSGFYEWKRSRNSIKIKEVVDFEIQFKTFEIQKDKYNPDGTKKPPMVGKIWGVTSDGTSVKVGTGKALPEPVRIHMLNNWDTDYFNKIGTCSAQRPSEKGKYIGARLDIIRLDRNSLD